VRMAGVEVANPGSPGWAWALTLGVVDMSPVTRPTGSTPRPEDRSGLLGQLSRFVLVGGLAALVDYGLYQFLLHLDVHASLAKSISFVCGTTTAYLLNKRFTFHAAGSGGAGRFTGFLLLYGSTLLVNVGVNALALKLIPNDVPWQTTICWVIAQGCATTINFLVLRTVIFRSHNPRGAAVT
jgi:putative flippase GtrA